MDISPLSTIARPWWRDITRPEWYALAAAHAGLALDAFDVMLYAFVLSTIMGEWGLKPATAGFVASVTLFASAFGGMLFGAVANRLGRKKTLMITVMIFSVCSGLSGLAQNVVQLAIARTALGLGYGGEWTSGALLVSETWRAEHRGKAIAIMQAGFPLGQIFAAVAAATLLPPFGWRVLFFIGVLPALFTLWIRTKVEEPRIWLETKHKPRSTTDLGFFQIFRKPFLRYTLLCVLTSSLGLIGYWGLFSWMPGFLALPLEKGGAGLGIAKAPIWLFPTLVASFIGTATFGFFSDRIGRRPTLAVFFGVSAILVWVFGHTRDAFTLLALGPLIGFFGAGGFGAFGAFIAELFPTQARGPALGFSFNSGRMMSAIGPTLIGFLSTSFGLGGALAFLAFAFAGAAASIFLLPETRGVALR